MLDSSPLYKWHHKLDSTAGECWCVKLACRMLDRLGSVSLNNILARKNNESVCIAMCKITCYRIAANEEEFWEHINETCGLV